jgi:putative membrane protein
MSTGQEDIHRGGPRRAAEDRSGFDPSAIERPIPALLSYYTLVAALTLVGFPFIFLPLYFKYHTLRYKFDDEGVSMAWGILFRREIYLTYRRIQDIHVSRNIFQRWMRLASVSVQTASGTAGAEMTIEGVENPEGLRDYLYSRMRGAEDEGVGAEGDGPAPDDEALALLHEIRDTLRELRAHREGPAP